MGNAQLTTTVMGKEKRRFALIQVLVTPGRTAAKPPLPGRAFVLSVGTSHLGMPEGLPAASITLYDGLRRRTLGTARNGACAARPAGQSGPRRASAARRGPGREAAPWYIANRVSDAR